MSTADPRGKFVWHELLSSDTASAGAFYPKVVSWKSQPWEHDSSYTVMMARSGPVGGIMGMPAGLSAASHWIPYVGVDDPHATVAQAKSMGAKVTKDVSSIPNGGQFAVLTDPQGAEFAIYKSSTPANGAATPGSGDFGWHELSTSDPDAALGFYAKLFGWEVGPKHDMGDMGPYHLFLRGGEQYGGVFKSGDSPNWLCYVRVDDVGKAANAVKAAGGRLLNGPMEVPGGTWVAQALDPEGSAFAIMEVKAMAAAQPKPAAAKPATPPKPKAPKPVAAAAPAPAPAAAPAKPAAAPAAKPAAAPAPAAKPAAATPAASAPKPPMKAAVKKTAKKKPAKKAAKRVAQKAAKKAKPAAKKAKKPAKKAAGKKKSAAKKKAKARKHR